MNVDPSELAVAAGRYGPTAYLCTVGDDGRPRVVHCSVRVQGSQVHLEVGPGSADNARRRPDVSLLWPATRDQSMSLIADGRATVGPPAQGKDPVAVTVEISSAVRHRAAPPLTQPDVG